MYLHSAFILEPCSHNHDQRILIVKTHPEELFVKWRLNQLPFKIVKKHYPWGVRVGKQTAITFQFKHITTQATYKTNWNLRIFHKRVRPKKKQIIITSRPHFGPGTFFS